MLVRLPALIATLIFLSSPILAQPAPSAATPQAGGQAAAVSDTVAVPIWPTAAVTLPEMQPAPASFSLGAIEGVAPDLLSGVTAKGYARKVPVDNQVIGQVQVLTVSKGAPDRWAGPRQRRGRSPPRWSLGRRLDPAGRQGL